LLLLLLATLAIALAAGLLLKNYPGTFILTLGTTTIEASFALLIAALTFISVALSLLLLLLLSIVNLPGNYRRWVRHRRGLLSEKTLIDGQLARATGAWRRAEQLFSKGAAYSSRPVLNYLLAADAAERQGRLRQRDHYLGMARAADTQQGGLVDLVQAEMLLRQGQSDQAYAILKNLSGSARAGQQANLMLLKASMDMQEWHGALDVLATLQGSKQLPAEQLRTHAIAAYAGLLRNAGKDTDRGRLATAWTMIPKKLRREPLIIDAYVRERMHHAGTDDCEVLIRKTLQRQWDPALVRLYGLVQGADNDRQLDFAEGLLREHPHDPVLLLTIGRLCRRASLWGKARSSLEASLAQLPSSEVCQELATLLEQEGDHAAAVNCYRRGLHLATGVNAGSIKLLRRPAGVPGPALARE
jgi:HemY protein